MLKSKQIFTLKYSFCFFVFSIYFSSFGQIITIKGRVIDKTGQQPLESATVYISSVKDSTIIDYTISDSKGFFVLRTKKMTAPFYLKVSFMGYQDYNEEIKALSEDKDMGALHIQQNPNDLQEVVIRTEAPPVRIKKDTLEFNASSFKVRQDSNVETLLKQLPGVSIDKDGKITINGKEVNKILIDGKPFFGNDGKVATQNLPSTIIDKIQVSNTKSKEQEFLGQSASSDNKTINLTVQKGKNKGIFGKLNGGGGSDGRYESGALINYFEGKQKLSFLGASNNINAVGFSMDDVFGAMGGGRVRYVGKDSGGSNSGGQSGGSNGITQSSIVGVNYADQLGKNVDPSGSYFYTSTQNNNTNRSKFQNLPNNTVSSSENTSRTITNSHKMDMDIAFKVNPMTILNMQPNYKKNDSHSTSTSSANTVNTATGELENDAKGYTDSKNENSTFDNTINLFRKFHKKGRSISLFFYNQNSKDQSERLTVSRTNLYSDAQTIDRNQLETGNTASDRYSGRVTYNESINDSLSINVGTKLEYNNQVFDKHTFGFDSAASGYTQQIAAQTNYISSKTDSFTPFVALDIRKKKMDGAISVGTQLSKFNNFSSYLGKETRLEKNYFFPAITATVNYRLSMMKFFTAMYDYSVTLPSPNQILAVENLADPLNTIVGNPDLDPTQRYTFSLSYSNFNMPTQTILSFYLGGLLYKNQIVTSTAYLESAVQRTTYENVNGTYTTFFGFNYGGNTKKGQHKFKYKIDINNTFGLDKGFYSSSSNPALPATTALYESRSYSFIPKMDLSWEYGDLLTISPSYTFNYNITDFKNFLSDRTSYYVHNFKLETTSYWPKHLVLGNDFSYNYNSNIADGFKKDFYLWNISLGYNFYNDKLLCKVKVYDLLDQNVNATRTVTPVAIQDVENTVLKRYVMFSLTYTIGKFGGSRKI